MSAPHIQDRSKIYKYSRVYLNDQILIDNTITLSKDLQHYLYKVMRKSSGDYIRIFNSIYGEFLAQLNGNYCIPQECIRAAQTDQRIIRLAVPIIKHDKMELIFDMCTELGVHAFIPLITERTQMHRANLKLERWNSIIMHSVEQSERLSVPSISHAISLNELLNNIPEDEIIACCIERLSNSTTFNIGSSKNVIIIIGPEGGFTEEEIAQMKSHKQTQILYLSRNVLRSETAAVAATTIVTCSAIM